MKVTTFAENFSCTVSSDLQFRFFLIPWSKKNVSVSCSNNRDYSSSFPVRYIPKNPRKIEESRNSSFQEGLDGKETHEPLETKFFKCEVSEIVKRARTVVSNSQNHIKSQIRTNSIHFNVSKSGFPDLEKQIQCDLGYLDNESIEEPEEVRGDGGIHHSRRGLEKDDSQLSKTKQDAEKFAIESLAVRSFTAVELRKKLKGRRFPDDAVDAVISDFQSRGLINDYLYAESFSRSRWFGSTWGPRRIKQVLYTKGVSEADSEKAVRHVFEDGESGDQESRLHLSKISMDHLFVQASKQWLRSREVPGEKRRSRIIRWLQYRGFDWGVISSVLKKLESQHLP